MTIYNCNLCNYTTNKSSNYTKHLKTNKHLNTVNIHNKYNKDNINNKKNYKDPIGTKENYKELCYVNNIQMASNNNIISENENVANTNDAVIEVNNNFKCKYCNKTYKYSKTLYKHQRTNCKEISVTKKNHLIYLFNKNGNTKNKLEMVNLKPTNITNINNGIINNNVINVNSHGNESIKHIPIEKMNLILKSSNNLIRNLCEQIYSLKENINTYVDTRNSLVYYISEDNKILMDNMQHRLTVMVEQFMEMLKDYIKDNDEIHKYSKSIFLDTYNIYFRIINKNNIDEEEYIDKECKELTKKFNNDIKFQLIKINHLSKILEGKYKEMYDINMNNSTNLINDNNTHTEILFDNTTNLITDNN
jgi:hypothetical protein